MQRRTPEPALQGKVVALGRHLLAYPSFQPLPVYVGDNKLRTVPEVFHLALRIHCRAASHKPGNGTVEVKEVCREVPDGLAIKCQSDAIVSFVGMQTDKLNARREIGTRLFPVTMSDDSGPCVAFRIQKGLEHIPNVTYTKRI